jgi:hypothetical protein
MNHKTIHTLLFLMLAALTANMVHVIQVHDQGVCDICLHLRSADDVDGPADNQTFIPSRLTFTPQISWRSDFHSSLSNSLDSIRGPPLFS